MGLPESPNSQNKIFTLGEGLLEVKEHVNEGNIFEHVLYTNCCTF